MTVIVTGIVIVFWADAFVLKLIVPRSDALGVLASCATTAYDFPASTVTSCTVRFVRLVDMLLISNGWSARVDVTLTRRGGGTGRLFDAVWLVTGQ
jgi:hypothetical protein